MSEYRELTAEENEKIRKHKMMLDGEEGGEWANFDEDNLQGVDLHDADLRFIYFQGTNLRGANLRGANLRKARLGNADMRGVELLGATIQGADLYNTNLCGVNFDYTSWPLWCGSRDAIVDDRLVAQLAFHLTRLNISKCSKKMKGDIEIIRKLSIANKFCEYRTEQDEI